MPVACICAFGWSRSAGGCGPFGGFIATFGDQRTAFAAPVTAGLTVLMVEGVMPRQAC